MIFSKGTRALALATIVAQVAVSQLVVAGGNNNFIVVQKSQLFDQTSAAGAVPDPLAPFTFDASCPVAMSFTPPGGTSTALTAEQGGNGTKYSYSTNYNTQALMDAAFPDGAYTLAVTGASSFMLNLTGDKYPNTPQVTGGTWNSSGQLVVDPTKDYTLNLSTFTAYGTGAALSHMQIQVQSFDESNVNLSQTYMTPTNSAPFTSYLIPAGTLAAGSIYQVFIEYDTAIEENTTAVTGDTAVTIYTANTMLTIVTSGTPASSPPTITQQPTDQQGPLGSTVTFSIGFNGNNSVVGWFKNGVAINGNNQNGANLTLTNIQNSDAGSYFAILENSSGNYVQSDTVKLTIGTALASSPVFSTQPYPQTISGGSTVVFHAIASGTPAPTYQWFHNGTPLANGAGVSDVTGPTLVVSGATQANAGMYNCVASNASGSTQSNAANLAVISTGDIGRLVNISCRAQVGTGGNILIAGFAVGGAGTSGSESLLIRGSGPALVPFGVGGTLPDPQLQLYSGTTVQGTDNGWAGATAISNAASEVGAFAWASPTSNDSALLESLPGGAYTAQIAGKSGDTGVALAEIYDATPAGTYTPTSPRIVNISARVQVGTGGNILIAGFVVGGSTARTVLIRASGPALAPFGVSGTLADPKLQLYLGENLLGSDSGWGGKAEIVSAAASVGAFPWSDPSSNDSAILATLSPGAYTAQVSGASGDTGVALVEIYEVP
jgi:hypothetical protein